jgi:hypothetical protein
MGHKCYKIKAVWCRNQGAYFGLTRDKQFWDLSSQIRDVVPDVQRLYISCEGTRRPILSFLFLSHRVQLSQSYLPFSPKLQKQLTLFLPVQITVASMSRLGS